MSRNSTKALIGEAGTRDFFNQWFPYAVHGGEGARIIPSNGMNDIGDVDGVPYCSIEVKNRKNNDLSGNLKNAQWKFDNSGRPIGVLVYKRPGYSQARAKMWNACTTVDRFLTGFLPVKEGTQEPAFDVDEIEQLCADQAEMYVDLTMQLPGRQHPDVKWRVQLLFRNFVRSIEDNKNSELDDYSISPDDEHTRVVPVMIHPRYGYKLGSWYVSTRLGGFARMMENVGVLPQDPDEYLVADQSSVI